MVENEKTEDKEKETNDAGNTEQKQPEKDVAAVMSELKTDVNKMLSTMYQSINN